MVFIIIEKVMLRNMKALSGSSLPLDRLSFYEIDTGINLFLVFYPFLVVPHTSCIYCRSQFRRCFRTQYSIHPFARDDKRWESFI